MNQKSIAVINGVQIILFEGETLIVPLKPIVRALNVKYSSQMEKL